MVAGFSSSRPSTPVFVCLSEKWLSFRSQMYYMHCTCLDLVLQHLFCVSCKSECTKCSFARSFARVHVTRYLFMYVPLGFEVDPH